MGASQEREPKPVGPGGRRTPDREPQQPVDAAATHSAGAALSRAAAGGLAGVRSPGLVRSLARSLGNRAVSRLAAEGELDISRQASGDTAQRTPGAGGGLTVNLTMTASATQYYTVDGETMEEVDGQLPDTLGEYHHASFCNVATRTSEEGEITVTGVTIPVTYYYYMPQWTRLGEQPPAIQAAWRRFYNDLMTHEREHLTVSRREYNKVRDALRALPAEEREEGNIMSVFNTAIEAQNQIHESHAGFSTPATLVFSDCIPPPPPPPPAAHTASLGAPEGEE